VCHSELGFICRALRRFPRDTMAGPEVGFEISIAFLFDSSRLLRDL
jgi:hypothetical protein